MGRKDRIRKGLEWAEAKGVIRSWQAQSSMPGMRWTVEGFGFTTRVYTTAEVEAFLLGASEGRTTAFLEATPDHFEGNLGANIAGGRA